MAAYLNESFKVVGTSIVPERQKWIRALRPDQVHCVIELRESREFDGIELFMVRLGAHVTDVSLGWLGAKGRDGSKPPGGVHPESDCALVRGRLNGFAKGPRGEYIGVFAIVHSINEYNDTVGMQVTIGRNESGVRDWVRA